MVDCKKTTPPKLAREWGIAPDKVLAWIRAGELRAFDGSSRVGGRPRYLIDREDIAAFERRRAAAPSAVSATRRQRWPSADGVIEFFDKKGTVRRRL